MNALISLLLLSAAGAVLVRCICVASKMSASSWRGHRLQFTALSMAYALLAGGASGTVLGFNHAPDLLLCGLALWAISERRREC